MIGETPPIGASPGGAGARWHTRASGDPRPRDRGRSSVLSPRRASAARARSVRRSYGRLAEDRRRHLPAALSRGVPPWRRLGAEPRSVSADSTGNGGLLPGPPPRSGGRRGAHRWVAACLGGVGCTCGVLPRSCTLTPGASRPRAGVGKPPGPADMYTGGSRTPSTRPPRLQARHARDLVGIAARAWGSHNDRLRCRRRRRRRSLRRASVAVTFARPRGRRIPATARPAPEFGFER